MQIPTLETPRLRLRGFRPADAAPLHRILTQEGMLRYFPSPAGPSRERVEAFVRNQIDQWDAVGYAWWAVELKTTGALLGWNGLQYLPETRETEIGYLLDHPWWGQGLATEATRASLRYGFEDLGRQEIIGLAHPENLASRRVMEKAGMRFRCQAEYFGMDMAKYSLDVRAHEARDRSRTAM